MKFSVHSAILCSMAFYATLMANGFFVIERGFVFRFKFLFLREVGLLMRPRGFLIRRFSKILEWLSMTFGFVMPSVRFGRTLTITSFGGRSFKGAIVELLTETA